jgi:integrase
MQCLDSGEWDSTLCDQLNWFSLILGITRERGEPPAMALKCSEAALMIEPLQAMLATCDDSLRGVRDRALLLFAWSSGGRRRSEVTDATLENTRRVGPHAFSFTLLHSTTNQTGALRSDSEKPILDDAADALAAWISQAGLIQGAIFRRVRRAGKVGEPLAPAAVRQIVKERAALAGLEPAFAAHSLRSGFITEAAKQGVPIGDTMAMTGHSSPASVLRYFSAAETSKSAAAHLLKRVGTGAGDAKPRQAGEES